MTCPRCEADVSGSFCSSCGASLQPTACSGCGAQPDPGDRFCNTCGTFLEGDARTTAAGRGKAPGTSSGTPNTGWLAAGGLMVVLILVLAWPRLGGGGARPVSPAGGTLGGVPVAGGASAVDLNAMTPRQAADRLFTRVMRGVSEGNDAEVQGFLPMAIAAYDRAVPLDADGQFHKALLQMTGTDPEAALATAEAGLEGAANHLLLLSVAAEASKELGREDAAAAMYGQLLEVWDAEMASGLADYQAHQQMMPEIESSARAFVDGR